MSETENAEIGLQASNSMSSETRLEYLKNQCRTTFQAMRTQSCETNRFMSTYYGRGLPENSSYTVL